ncbi:endonuclease domain-containing protein [Streptomyces albidoflavus]|uniref:endonuclease domain-containing protein n=1 Tax=Streptomyces albidoflavus TaxID=1886 RepID=UPI00101E5435|nr:endonuclease domain-containing protein [Streptomyces albidoflavus]RZD92214.1 endonuclease VII [Streptomyces albidoflavus]
MWLSLQSAHQRLADLTHHTAVPAYLDHVNRYTFAASGHVLIGDAAVHGYKHRQRWRFLDRDIQKAARQLAELRIDAGDLVDACLASSELGTWRSRVSNWISEALYDLALGKPGGDTALIEGAAGEQLPEAVTRRTIASTRPLPLMAWSGSVWLIPRAYAALLDRSEETEARLVEQDEVCSGCGAPANREQWRSSSATGFVALCPPCAAESSRPYTGHLRGRQYTKAFAKRSRADAFLCQMCPEPRRALYWDHCHVHELFRGPLCVRCNNAEGGSGFIDRPKAVEYLLQCTGCRAQRTLPPQHHADVVRRLFEFEPPEACAHEVSWRWFHVEDDGSVVARFRCYQHQPALDWAVTVEADDVGILVRRFLEKELESDL